MKRQNALTGFIDAFAKNNGYPKWDKSVVEYKKQNSSANFTHASSAEGSYDTLVFTPVVREGENYVSSFILAHVGDTVRLNLYREKDYDFHPDGVVDSTVVTAERVSLELMELNKKVYGYSKFEIKDSLLFRGAFPATINIDKRTIELTNVLYSTGKVYWAYTCFVKGSNFLRGDTTATSSDQGGGGGDCWEWSFEIEDPYSWPPDTPSGPECPCGGGGGGGSNPTTPPPSNCTGTPDCTRGTEIIDGREPCGNCGPGPIVVIIPLDDPPNIFSDLDNPIDVPPTEIIDNGLEVTDAGAPSTTGRLIGKSPCKGNTEDMDHNTNGNTSILSDPSLLALSDSYLFNNMTALFDACTFFDNGLREVGHEMIQKFRDRTGGIYSNSTLDNRAGSSSELINYIKNSALNYKVN